jgi:hypothetical protein
MALLGVLLAILLGAIPLHGQTPGNHHAISAPTDTLGEGTGG